MKLVEGRLRTVISHVTPQIEEGLFAIKRIIGDEITITANIFADGHHSIAANLLFRSNEQTNWQEVPMKYRSNDCWEGKFIVENLGVYTYTIQAWIDYFKSWQQDLTKKFKAGFNVQTEIEIGIHLLQETLQHEKQTEIEQFLTDLTKSGDKNQQIKCATNEQLSLLMRNRYPNKQWVTQLSNIFPITVDPHKARFSTWYELFPRSFSSDPYKQGSFKDCQQLLPEIAQMGFDVLYFPPIHPIGYSKRKGKLNQIPAGENDPGSPWAIGSVEGGHKSIHPALGSLEDFEHLVSTAHLLGIDIALDIALQCSLDHPYLKEHPDWFYWRPDGKIQYAENPPKKYEDIVPFYFETKDWKALWKELRSIFLYWIEKGIGIFRVDNPHTKPFAFWEWLITTIKKDHPEVIFLAEAFTRPKIMYWLSKIGFSQSYTYFTWRHTKQELIEYFTEIALSPLNDYFRPNLWPNTPDILSEELQRGGRPTFITRLILAATLSPNYGLYSPAFELMEIEAVPGTEEYLNSEKYQLREWNRKTSASLKMLITHMNRLRKNSPALQYLSNLKFLEIDNDQIIYYSKFYQDQTLLILINLDPFHAQSGTLKVPLKELGLYQKDSYKVQDLLSEQYNIWEGETQKITLDLHFPACIFSVHKKVQREADFEYFL